MPTKVFGTVRQKLFDGKLWYPKSAWNFSIPQIFWKIEEMPMNFFGIVRQKIFDKKLWYPLLCIIFFRYLKVSETLKGCPQNFRHCETKNFRGKKRDTPLFSHTFFGTRNFLKNSKIPLRKFSALWEIKNSTETHDMNLLSIYFFRYQRTSGKQKGYFTKLLVSVL